MRKGITAARLAEVAQNTPEVTITYSPPKKLLRLTRPSEMVAVARRLVDFRRIDSPVGSRKDHRIALFFTSDRYLLTWYHPKIAQYGESEYIAEIYQIASRVKAAYVVHIEVISQHQLLDANDLLCHQIDFTDMGIAMYPYGLTMNDFFIVNTAGEWQYFEGEKAADIDPFFRDRETIFCGVLSNVGGIYEEE